jgi:hypothetical protein
MTRDDVALVYRALLGRAPESEQAFADGLAAGSVEALRRRILDGPEFAAKMRRDAPQRLRRWMLEEMQHQQAPAQDTPGEPRLVFLHLMKTAGTTLRHRLESLVPGNRIWRREREGLPGDHPPETLAPYRLFLGHFTMRDALHIPAPRRIVTLLRDPKDRLVSLYHFYARHRDEVIARLDLHEQRIARRSTLAEFLRNPDARLRAVTHNALTCALAGDVRPVGRDRYRMAWDSEAVTISAAELLERALANLRRLDAIGFAERLDQDRPRLMDALGLPDSGPLPRENTRDLESDLLEPRPWPEITPEAQAELNRATELDRMLYRLARLHTA